MFQGGHQSPPHKIDNLSSIRPSDSPAASNKPLLVPSERNLTSSPTTPKPAQLGPSDDITLSERRLPRPKWSVVYNPRVERALELHLAHAFAHDSSVQCAKMSPDGQKLAVGLEDNGKTYLYELRTESKIWLVRSLVFKIWVDVIDPSVFVDQYVKRVKNGIDIYSVKFSPNGRLLAIGACDLYIRVCPLKM